MTADLPAIAKPVQPSFRIFKGNYNQLNKFLEVIDKSPQRFELWSQHNNYWFGITEETTRLFFNLSVSAVTYVKLVDNLFKSLPEIDELSQLRDEYNNEVKEHFENNPGYQLIYGLRQYLVHVDTVAVGGTYTFNWQLGHNHAMVIAKEKLDIAHGFNRIARKRIRDEKQDIAIGVLADECNDNLQSFQDWLWQKQRDLCNDRRFSILL
jgi:hypothetical protein